ncbi:uncharacterized protein LOC135349357 [Halichondria panicea]|uniref:uncharacterized protein LOC135349357 n=1 Tax=Halichondria panicea TaxID=6063 RepID=UPI00312B42FF
MCKSLIQCLLVAAALRVMLPAVGVGGVGEESGVGEGSGAGSGILQAVQDRQFSINLTDVIMPVCTTNQLLSYNGTEFLCKEIPERKCVCPSPMVGTDEPPTFPPEPPGGCPVFDPPDGGGFVCLPNITVIHCSVLCDNSHEFSTTPLNPYHCGQDTRFQWEDFTRTTHKDLPQCSGFRYTLRPLHRAEYYLPSPCPLVTQTEADTVKTRFCDLLSDFVDKDQINCTTSNAFIQCPKTAVTTVIPPNHPELNP